MIENTREDCGCYVGASLADGELQPFVWRCRLHDSAPDLLAALERIVELLPPPNGEVQRVALAAIAHAWPGA